MIIIQWLLNNHSPILFVRCRPAETGSPAGCRCLTPDQLPPYIEHRRTTLLQCDLEHSDGTVKVHLPPRWHWSRLLLLPWCKQTLFSVLSRAIPTDTIYSLANSCSLGYKVLIVSQNCRTPRRWLAIRQFGKEPSIDVTGLDDGNGGYTGEYRLLQIV